MIHYNFSFYNSSFAYWLTTLTVNGDCRRSAVWLVAANQSSSVG